MAGRSGRGNRHGYFESFIDDDDDDEFEDRIFLNPFRTTYYLGRGRFGDNSRLHRGIMLIREREEAEGAGFSGFHSRWRPIRRRRRREMTSEFERAHR